MSVTIHAINDGVFPEIFGPSFTPAPGGPIGTKDARLDFASLTIDMKTAWDFAIAKALPVLNVAADRNGAYLVIAPTKDIYELFGDECGQWRRHTDNGMTTEYWLGRIGHIRVFWREFKCTAH